MTSDLIIFSQVHYFLPVLLDFNEHLYPTCSCLELSSEQQISFHSCTHYRAIGLCPRFLSSLSFSDSCRVCIHPICRALEKICCQCSTLPSKWGSMFPSSDSHFFFSSSFLFFLFFFLSASFFLKSFAALGALSCRVNWFNIVAEHFNYSKKGLNQSNIHFEAS